jgi:hypothetical protein
MPAAAYSFAWVLYPSATVRFPKFSAQLLPASNNAIRLQVNIPGEEQTEMAFNFGKVQFITMLNGYDLAVV